MDVTKPILKWVGGKTQIIEKLISQFPHQIKNYHEPFIGGGSVLLAFLCQVQEGKIKLTGKVYASDKNSTLVAFYQNIQQNPDNVIRYLKELVDVYNNIPSNLDNNSHPIRKHINYIDALKCQEQYYYWIRQCYNELSHEEKISSKGTSYFIFLNKTCFRGLYREGPNGFNVPFGNYKNPSIFDEDHILIVSSLLKDVIFTSQGFNDSLSIVQENDFVYLDPPYVPENSTSFVGYTVDGFTQENHVQLFAWCKDITRTQNIRFVMSNADVEFVRQNFPESIYIIYVIDCRRSINSKKPQARTNEVIIKWV
jgi:DNA adenine methylase